MQSEAVSAVILVGPGGSSPQEVLVQDALQAAVLDLLDVLNAEGVHPVVVAGPELDWLPAMTHVIADVDQGEFHFGQRLAGLIERYDLSPVIYFGAGSAPLLTQDMLGLLHGMLHQSAFGGPDGHIPSHIALTNNLHSSDWVGLSHARDALGIIRRATRDNSLAWMLQQEWMFDVRVLSGVCPASSMDLDTPTDLAVVRHHPARAPHLAEVLRSPMLDRVQIGPVLDVIARPESHLALIGRVSPLAWQALNKASQCWVRVFSEERGMVASERLVRGEVKSLVGRLLAEIGPDVFFSTLAGMADAAIIDSRVLMAANAGQFPGRADRFASDLLMVEAVQHDWLKEFTRAAAQASIPIILGGHAVVAGGLYALVDVLNQRR